MVYLFSYVNGATTNYEPIGNKIDGVSYNEARFVLAAGVATVRQPRSGYGRWRASDGQ